MLSSIPTHFQQLVTFVIFQQKKLEETVFKIIDENCNISNLKIYSIFMILRKLQYSRGFQIIHLLPYTLDFYPNPFFFQ